MAKENEPSASSLTMADLIAALKASAGTDDESMKKRAQYEAEAYERLHDRENRNPPKMSHYSYPEGDAVRPKPALKCKMFWIGFDEHVDVLTPEEIALMNLAEAGEYVFSKTDGSQSKLTVTGEKDTFGKYQRLLFDFPCKGDNRHNLPGRIPMLREAFGQKTQEDELRAELAALRAQLQPVGAR